MIRGFYTAASGIVSQEKKLNSVANNMANVNTVGYKQDNVVMGTFGEHVALRMNAYQRAGYRDIGDSVYMQVVDEKYTDHSQGTFETTTRHLDMSIMGDGFFVVADEEGELLTRDGQFSMDEEGYLILPGFGRVQGENGDIELPTSLITVDTRGHLYVENEDGEQELLDRLIIVQPSEGTTIEKWDNSLYLVDDYEEMAVDGTGFPVIRQYNLEKSNVNLSDEMTRMMESQRSLQSCSQIVKMYDDLAEQINTRISRI